MGQRYRRMDDQGPGLGSACNQDFARRRGFEKKSFSKMSKLGDVVSKLAYSNVPQIGVGGKAPSRWAIFCNALENIATSILMLFGSHFASFRAI